MKQYLTTYQQKLKVLGVGFLLLSGIIFMISIKPTMDLRANNALLEEKIAIARSAPAQIKTLQSKKASLEKSTRFLDQPFRMKLLSLLKACTHRYLVQLKAMNPDQARSEEVEAGEQYEVVLEGDFAGLLQALNRLEQELPPGSLAATQFYLNRTPGSRKEKLFMKISLQYVIHSQEASAQ